MATPGIGWPQPVFLGRRPCQTDVAGGEPRASQYDGDRGAQEVEKAVPCCCR